MSYPHTRIPQWFFELIPELEEAELRIMLVIYRHTLGWKREQDDLSYSQLLDETGLGSRTTISKSLVKLEKRGLITRRKKRVTAQTVQVFPFTPVLPLGLVHSVDSESPVSGPPLVHSVDSQKKPTKKTFKETNTIVKFSPDQVESLALVVGGGVDQKIARRLILLAWSRGRQADYIQRIVGYVSSLQNVKNPAGMIVSLIERNNDRIPTSDGQQGPERPENGDYHYFDAGGPELVRHTGKRADCEICGKESNEL